MEFEVRVVGGIESCFVSLPLLLIQTLQQTRPGPLPSFLALELRSRNAGDLWHVAWCGSASSSSAIEIAQHYAECIYLPDHTNVQVRAVSNVPKATLVTIEPHSEDDWEVLELNSESAEAAILEQVGIVHEAMRFPLWLQGRTIITFLVVSTFPKNPIVQLVPGTEVAVAPKRRKRSGDSCDDSSMQSSDKEHCIGKALLRIQDSDDRLIHKCEVNGVEMGVVLTSVIFVHPETATNHSLGSQPVVIVPRLRPKESFKNLVTDTLNTKNSSIGKQFNGGIVTDKQDYRQAVVYLLISDSVAKGHAMLSKSLCLYLRASLHSWIYVKRCHINLKKEVPLLSLSPCQLKVSWNTKDLQNSGLEVIGSRENRTTNDILEPISETSWGIVDWSTHGEVLSAISNGLPSNSNEEAVTISDIKNRLRSLLHAWYSAQLHVIASNAGVEVTSLVLGNKSLLHFVMKEYRTGKNRKVQTSSTSSFGTRTKTGEAWIDILYVLSTFGESIHGDEVYAYELAFDKGNMGENNLKSSELLLGKMNLGDPVYLDSVKEKISEKFSSTQISSVGWMGTAVSEVINRLIVLLSSDSRMLLSSYSLPSPGHVLIYGPPGSGKTLLATAVAKSVEEHEDIFAHIVFVRCSKLALEKSSTVRQSLSGYVSEALEHAPSVVIFDDLDSIISHSTELEGSQPSSYIVELTHFLSDIMDEYEEKRRNSCGIGPIAFVASVQSLTSIPQSLSSSGRFDFHVQLLAPAASERVALLKHEIQKRSLQCSDDILLDVASKCDGYDAYDLVFGSSQSSLNI
ncbi:hypothetical protein U1Q18_036505 [Sarracenia purpurea var. burkii]